MGGAGWHGSKSLPVPDSTSVLLRPPYPPKLTPVDNIWADRRGTCPAKSVVQADSYIVKHCCDAWTLVADGQHRVGTRPDREYATAVGPWGRWHQSGMVKTVSEPSLRSRTARSLIDST